MQFPKLSNQMIKPFCCGISSTKFILFIVILLYNEPRTKLRPLVQNLQSVFSYHLSTFRVVIELVMLLSGCLYISSKFSVSVDSIQWRKYIWSILQALYQWTFSFYLSIHTVGALKEHALWVNKREQSGLDSKSDLSILKRMKLILEVSKIFFF